MNKYLYSHKNIPLNDFDTEVEFFSNNGYKLAFCFPMMKHSGTTQLNGQPVMEYYYDCIFEKIKYDA